MLGTLLVYVLIIVIFLVLSALGQRSVVAKDSKGAKRLALKGLIFSILGSTFCAWALPRLFSYADSGNGLGGAVVLLSFGLPSAIGWLLGLVAGRAALKKLLRGDKRYFWAAWIAIVLPFLFIFILMLSDLLI